VQQRELFLDGRARRPHSHTRVLRSLEEPGQTGTDSSSICSLCAPVLTRYVSDFKGMVHCGGELKRRKSINPHPKCSDIIHYQEGKMNGSEPLSLIVLGTISIAMLVYGLHLVYPRID